MEGGPEPEQPAAGRSRSRRSRRGTRRAQNKADGQGESLPSACAGPGEDLPPVKAVPGTGTALELEQPQPDVSPSPGGSHKSAESALEESGRSAYACAENATDNYFPRQPSLPRVPPESAGLGYQPESPLSPLLDNAALPRQVADLGRRVAELQQDNQTQQSKIAALERQSEDLRQLLAAEARCVRFFSEQSRASFERADHLEEILVEMVRKEKWWTRLSRHERDRLSTLFESAGLEQLKSIAAATDSVLLAGEGDDPNATHRAVRHLFTVLDEESPFDAEFVKACGGVEHLRAHRAGLLRDCHDAVEACQTPEGRERALTELALLEVDDRWARHYERSIKQFSGSHLDRASKLRLAADAEEASAEIVQRLLTEARPGRSTLTPADAVAVLEEAARHRLARGEFPDEKMEASAFDHPTSDDDRCSSELDDYDEDVYDPVGAAGGGW